MAIYTRSQLPFRAKISWEIDVSKAGEIQSHWRRSPPITLSPAMPAQTLHTFVVELLKEYKIALSSITGSGWTVSAIKSITIDLVPAQGVLGGTWIKTPDALAVKHVGQC